MVYPLFDETYYWRWGQSPALSYHDHPGMQAWTLGLFQSVFGTSQFVLRLPAAICTIVMMIIYSNVLRKLGYAQHRWPVILGFLVTPLIFLLTSIAWNDYLMMTMVLCSAYFWMEYLSKIWQNQKGSGIDLFLGFLFLGCSGLSKYNAVFIAFALATLVLFNKNLRPVLKDYKVYLGILFSLLIISPIFIWNLNNDNGSFQFTLSQRTITPLLSLEFKGNIGGFVIGSILTLSPFVWYAIVQIFRKKDVLNGVNKDAYTIVYVKLAKHLFLWSTLTMLFISTSSLTFYWWNIVGYLLILPLALLFLNQKKQMIGHLIYGTLANSLIIFHLGILPFNVFFDGAKDDENAYLYGWNEIGNAVNQEIEKYPEGVQLFTSNYRTCSLLSFRLDRKDIFSYSPRFDQFDYWTHNRTYPFKKALILSDDWQGMNEELYEVVDSIQITDTISISQWGYHIKDYYLWRGIIKSPYLKPEE